MDVVIALLLILSLLTAVISGLQAALSVIRVLARVPWELPAGGSTSRLGIRNQSS